jgi:hypothetical protein
MSKLESAGFALGWCGYTHMAEAISLKQEVGFTLITQKEGVTHTALGCIQIII